MPDRKTRLCVLIFNTLEAKLFLRALEVEFDVVTFGAVGDELMKAIPECDLLLMRESDSPKDRLAFLRRALEVNPDLKVLVIESKGSMGPLVYLEEGAAGFVEREASVDSMIDHIHSAEKGEIHLSDELGGTLLRRVQELAELCVDREVDPSRCHNLTDREREVAGLLDRRHSNEEIAGELGIALGTAKSHVHNILRKLDVDRRTLAGLCWRIYSKDEGSAQPPVPGHTASLQG
ncbi:MAG: LuxR C-terminal-related transcriptional regulator [Gemmatimonadota bacterium]